MTPTSTEKKQWVTPVVKLLDEAKNSENGPGPGPDGAGSAVS